MSDWKSELINVAFLALILAAGFLKVLPDPAVEMLVVGLVGARLALLKPPGPPSDKGGPGAAVAGSALGAVVLGVLALLGAKVQS